MSSFVDNKQKFMKKEQLMMMLVTVAAVLVANFIQDKIDEKKSTFEADGVGDDEFYMED